MLGSTDRRDVGEIGTHTLQGQQLRPVAQIPGVTRSVDHREPSRLTTDKVTAKHAHVRGQASPGRDEEDMLIRRHLGEREEPTDLWGEPQPVAH